MQKIVKIHNCVKRTNQDADVHRTVVDLLSEDLHCKHYNKQIINDISTF